MSNALDQELRKALDTSYNSGTNVGGGILINEAIEREIHDLVITDSPILQRITRKSWPTNAYNYRRRIDGPTAGFIADGGAMVAASQSKWDKVTVPMKYVYSRVEVTGPMQWSVRDQGIDLLAYELDNAARGLSRTLETKIVTGNSDAGNGGDADEFDGLDVQITTNELDLEDNGTNGKLYLKDMDEALDKPHRTPTTIIGGRAFGRRMASLLQAQQRFIDRTEVDGGFQVMTYRGLPILLVDNEFADSTVLEESVFMIDHRRVEFVVQRDAFVEQLAKNKDSDDYFIGMYCTLAVIDENFYHAKIVNADFSIESA